MTEFETKQQRLRALLEQRQLDALLLQRASSFAWATGGGRSYINTAASDGVASLLITRDCRYLITNNIEAQRLEREEGLAAQNWEILATPWHARDETLAQLTRGLKWGADVPLSGACDLSAELARLRANLTPAEGERFRTLGKLCAVAMNAAIHAVRPRMTEYEIASLLACETESRGAQAIVNLVATDERIFRFRHPLPTNKELEHYAMLVLCARKWGLVGSITRLVHFGRLPDELRRKQDACARVDAAMIAATRPGAKLGKIFQRAVNAYTATGFVDEWQMHHQGGPAGYEPREWLATPNSTDEVKLGQAYAWNPSITGVKSEDTILIGERGNEILTTIVGWQTLTVSLEGQTLVRAAILEIT